MASKGMEMGLVMVLVTMIWVGANAQSGCTKVIIGMSPCLNFVTGNSSTPSSSCCSQLANVVQSNPQCLCSMLSGGGTSLGITINQTLALALPGACSVQTPPVSKCNGANGPTTSPVTSQVDSPASSPVDNTDEEPDSPTTPSVDDIPAESGSKTVPTKDGKASNGNTIAHPLPLTIFLLFIMSCASIVNNFLVFSQYMCT